jgi:hypothetical protein
LDRRVVRLHDEPAMIDTARRTLPDPGLGLELDDPTVVGSGHPGRTVARIRAGIEPIAAGPGSQDR